MSQRAEREVQWPPRSPHDALLSTPGGRDRLRRLASRTSPSPSPIRQFQSAPSLDREMKNGDVDEDDDDEETLVLKMQEIQAKLKLKKLRAAKAKDKDSSDFENDSAGARIRPRSRTITNEGRQDIAELKQHRLEKSRSQANVHVPASPTRRVRQPEEQRSPSRILLGIDKGIKASDISLKRVPSLRTAPEDSVANVQRAGVYLQRASSPAGLQGHPFNRAASVLDGRPRTTFSGRMANVRTEDAERREKDARIKQARNKAFDIDSKDLERFKAEAAILPEFKTQPLEFSRDQIIEAYNQPSSGLLQRSKSASDIGSKTGPRAFSGGRIGSKAPYPSSRVRTSHAHNPLNESRDPSEFESFSSLHLSKRIIPHTVLTRTLSGKKAFIITDLLKEVTSPHFRLPDIEEDIVLLGVVASKSEPRMHKVKSTNEEGAKYMALTLTDLKWELELFLFGSAFEKFWKLQPGTVIAILNPGIMPPMKADTGRFSMTLNSNDDTILEIGNARDLGFCKSVKKDGKTCDSWIDNRHTEYCEYHINETLQKTKANRMEVNTMDFGGGRYRKSGPGKSFGARKYNSKHVSFDPYNQRQKGDGSTYDQASHSTLFMSDGKRSSSRLIDDVDIDPDAFHRGSSKEERMRRQFAAKERERKMEQNLALVGGGLGAAYMRARENGGSNATGEDGLHKPGAAEPPDAMKLGLLGGKAKDVHLSPLKRKRAGTMSTSINTTAMGWGGNLSKELGRMRDGERLQPIKKKTRFVTAKGIREAGRESFGGEAAMNADNDDDDDLDIV